MTKKIENRTVTKNIGNAFTMKIGRFKPNDHL